MASSNLLGGLDWPELTLVKQLGAPYNSALERVYHDVEPLLKTRPLGAEEFTDHDLDHSARIVNRIGQILPECAQLNQPELYILLLAALLHDAGMWTSKTEAHGLLDNPDFIRFCDAPYHGELDTVKRALASSERQWMGNMGLQRLAASYNRVIHPERLRDVVLKSGSATGNGLQTLIGAEFVDAVADVAIAHGWDRKRVLDDDALRPRLIGNERINLRYLAQLLRLGDLLDLGEGRVSTLIWDYLRPLSADSESHWRKEARLRVENCSPDKIEISGIFNVDAYGIQEAEAYRLSPGA